MAAVLATLALAGLPFPFPTQPPAAFDSLNRILAPVRFTPPDMTLNISKGTLTLQQIDCANISLGDLSLPSAPLSGGGSEAALVLSKLALACQAVISEAIPPLPTAKGDKIDFSILADASLEFSIHPTSNATGALPSQLSLERCSVTMPNITAVCTPKLSPLCLFINGALPGIVKAVLNTTVCTALGKQVAPAAKVNQYLGLIALLLEQWALPVPAVSVADGESYLQPYSSELATWSMHGKFARLGRLIDFVPSWIINLVIDHFFHHGKAVVPLNVSIPLQLPAGLGKATLALDALDVDGINSFTTLKPLKLESGFTWRAQLALKHLSVTAGAKLTLEAGSSVHGLPPGGAMDVQVSIPLEKVAVDLSVVVAMNSTRLCELSGQKQTSSLPCMLWPVAHAARGNTVMSGLNITHLSVSIGDLGLSVSGLGAGLDAVVNGAVAEVMTTYKAPLLKALPNGISDTLKDLADSAAYKAIVKEQQEHPCGVTAAAPAVSRVCVLNHAGFVMNWKFRDCASGAESPSSGNYPIMQKRCLEVTGVPNATAGSVIRVVTDAAGGKRQVTAEALRYAPDSNEAVYTCRGTTLDYKCTLQSLTPVSPGTPPKVSKVCVANDAGFVLRWHATDRRTGGASSDSGDYPVDQTRCIDLGPIPGVKEGDSVDATVKAVLGKTKDVATPVIYSNSSYGATFTCRGTTLSYHCNLLTVA
eukprot:TRINITY_DN973_c0_g1_i3.p1 TRINITY_DN973_c0_g1~~TRINITY_DN973_c0_g1_i3.p1  ORF type:complete len:704 (+),score=278.46 TRINITY_DN973_c0_g1_i3:82-2193(+)